MAAVQLEKRRMRSKGPTTRKPAIAPTRTYGQPRVGNTNRIHIRTSITQFVGAVHKCLAEVDPDDLVKPACHLKRRSSDGTA